jgi:cyclopropane-fatty-acyl-phospholipid synthase
MPQERSQNPGASLEAIQYHYDVGNSFYRLWLDGSLTYSSALWEDNDTLEMAQLRKIDYHINQARAHEAKRVLDIGCGWGSVLKRLVAAYGVGQAAGLTLSEAQAKWITSFDIPQIEVRLESWVDHSPQAPYDAIISIGAFEHFAKWGLSKAEKIAGYRKFFSRCHKWLKPEGRISLQTIAYGSSMSQEAIQASPISRFLAKFIFPDSDIPGLAEIVEATEGLFEIVAMRNDREHYARTSRAWLERLNANRAEANKLVGEKTVAQYCRYLEIWAHSFEVGTQALLRMTLLRLDRPWKK